MPVDAPDPDLIALGIRQPWLELILRGIKTVEVRSLGTARRGTIYLYSSKKVSDHPAAREAAKTHGIEIETLPLGVLVGTVEILDSRPCTSSDAADACLPRALVAGKHGWRLRNPCRLSKPLPVRFLPYGVWFYPFKRRNGSAK